MSLTHKTTLLEEADASAVQTYIDTLMNSHRDSTTKREVLIYLKRILQADREKVRDYQSKIARMNTLISRHASRQELASQADISHLFTADSRTVDQLIALLQADNGILYGVDYTFDSAVFAPLMSNETRFVITGDSARFLGESNEGSAKTQELQCSCVVKAPLHLKPKAGATEVMDVVIDGVRFEPTTEHTVTFETKVQNLTFTNCIFDGTTHSDSKCIWGTTQTFEGTLTLKNCIIKNYNEWGYMDPTTTSGTPSKQLALVDIQDCLFLNNKGSMAFRTVQDPAGAGFSAVTETFQFLNNKIDVSGLEDLHNLYWSAIECNNFEKVVVKGNDAQGIRATSTGDRGFLQIWSKGPDMILEVENNKLTDFNIGYQLAFGGEPGSAAVFKGCTSATSFVTMRQGDLTRVDHTHKLVYPWLSSTAAVNISGSGVLPTITVPNSEDDLTVNDYPHIETFSMGSEADLDNHIFQLGSNTTGYIQVDTTAPFTEQGLQWFKIFVQSDVLAASPHKLWQDTIISDYRIIEQERSFNSSGIMEKRNRLGANVPTNTTSFFKLYFRID